MILGHAHRAAILLPGVLAVVGAPAAAQQWTMNSSAETRAEAFDNYRPDAAAETAVVRALSLRLAGELSRSDESVSTRLAAEVVANAARPRLPGDRGAAVVQLEHTVTAPRDAWSASGSHRLDSTYGARLNASDAGLGFGARTTDALGAAWSHLLSERLSARVALAATAVSYSADVLGGVDYRNASLAPALNWRWSEIDSVGLQTAVSRYRTDTGSSASTSHSASLVWQRTLGEAQTVSLSAGAYRTRTDSTLRFLACPLPIGYCQAGLVNYVVATRTGRSSSTGTQFSASLSRRLGERSGVALAVSRQLSPSGAGAVTREDQLSVGADHALTPEISITVGAAWSRALFVAGDASAQPRVQNQSLAIEHRLSEGMSVVLDARRTRNSGSGDAASAATHRVGISLRFTGPRARF